MALMLDAFGHSTNLELGLVETVLQIGNLVLQLLDLVPVVFCFGLLFLHSLFLLFEVKLHPDILLLESLLLFVDFSLHDELLSVELLFHLQELKVDSLLLLDDLVDLGGLLLDRVSGLAGFLDLVRELGFYEVHEPDISWPSFLTTIPLKRVRVRTARIIYPLVLRWISPI